MPLETRELRSLFEFMRRQRRLSYIDRCNQIPKIKPYSVAEHSYFCAVYAMILCDIVNNTREKGKTIDVEEVLRRTLIHDHEESITGDILYPMHNEFPEFGEALEKVRNAVVDKQAFDGLPEGLVWMYQRLWRAAKDETDEGRMVVIVDKFEIVMFALQEMELGNHSFRSIYVEAMSILRKEGRFPVIHDLLKVIERTF